MMHASPALAMLARLKWLIKQSANRSARKRQRTGSSRAGAESPGTVMGRSSQFQAPSSKETSSTKLQTYLGLARVGVWDVEPLWSLEFGCWSFSSPRLRDEESFHEFFVQSDAKPESVRHCDRAVFGLQLFLGELVAHGRVINAIFEN